MEMAAFLDEHFRAAGVDAGRAVGADRRAADKFLNERRFRAGFDDDKCAGKAGGVLAAEFINHFERHLDTNVAGT